MAIPPSLPAPHGGRARERERPGNGRLEARVSLGLALLASLSFGAFAAWEIAGPIHRGHFASSASMGIIAENMQRWGIVAPVWSYGAEAPRPADYYCHHPLGIFHTTALFFAVFGRHDFVCRLPAVVISTLTPLAIHALGRALFRPCAGAAAAWAFAVLPISLSFAAFNALEVPTIFWSTLTLLAWTRQRERPGRLRLAALGLAAALALACDWPAYVLVGCLAAIEIARAALLRGDARAAARDAALVLGGVALASGLAVLALFARWGQLDDLWSSAALRSASDRASFFHVLDRRRFWIELMFTSVGVGIGKAGAIVGLGRLWLAPHARELALPASLAMALFQYVAFRQGAEIHVFWPHYFALSFALATATLVATLAALLEPLRRAGRLGAHPTWAIALASALLPLAAIGREGLIVADWARATGGRFSEKGALIESRADAVATLTALGRRLPRDVPVALHRSLDPSWAEVWALGGRPTPLETSLRPDASAPWVVADLTRLDREEVRALLAERRVELYERVAVIGPGEGVTAYRFARSEPSARAWWLESAHSAQLSPRADPFLAAELAAHYGLEVAPPEGEPGSRDALREAHNLALARGDAEAAARLYARALAGFEPRDDRFDDGTTLVGVRLAGGVEPRLTLLFRAGAPARSGVVPHLRARLVEPVPGSLVSRDPAVRELLPPPLYPRSVWREGFLYDAVAPLLPRPGLEALSFSFEGPAAARPSAGPIALPIALPPLQAEE